jgi:hypothetical protein
MKHIDPRPLRAVASFAFTPEGHKIVVLECRHELRDPREDAFTRDDNGGIVARCDFCPPLRKRD